jgi:pyruvate/2-oxoacid:ferredoxin oxidoreductase alpha subunit
MTSLPPSRAWARDVLGAVGLVEGALATRILSAVDGLEVPALNVFGEPITLERQRQGGADVGSLVRSCADAAARGERVALVARAADLACARGELAELAASRLAVVVHALADPAPWGVPASQGGIAPALALGDLPWGMLLGAGVAEVLDLALVARRAAEDSGCPFFVVHEATHAHHVETVSLPSRELCEAFAGAARGSVAGVAPGTEGDRAVAQRVPFALASALRELEALSGRHHDVIERVPAADAAVAFVGAGGTGDSLVADVERLRASGHDVGAVRIVAWRPFPAARLVKALSRALVVSVLERVDQPLACNPPLASHLKAAFADAITWAPDYPGVGRIPRIVSGVVAPHREVDSTDLDAIMHNVLADERGKRSFVLGGDDAHGLATPPVQRSAGDVFAMRGVTSRRELAIAAGELAAAVLTSAFGVRVRVAVRAPSADEGGGVAFDLLAAKERPRGLHAPHAVHLVVLEDTAALARGNPFLRLASGGAMALPTMHRSAAGLWGDVPAWARALAFDREGRVLGWTPAAPGQDLWTAAAAFVGIALAVAAGLPMFATDRVIDANFVEREVGDALRVALAAGPNMVVPPAGHSIDDAVKSGVGLARDAFASHVEVPKATVQREDEMVRLGRLDARASSSAPAPAR